MEKRNFVYIATSIDGYIADKNGGIEWLETVPNPDNSDLGFVEFNKQIDALIMGRNTFETVCGFDVDWPYTVPVFVLSNSLKEIPGEYTDKAFLINGDLKSVLAKIHEKGYHNLYVDGGSTIQSFLKQDLIDDLIITKIPILLGGGIPLFRDLDRSLTFDLVSSTVMLNQLVQSHYKRSK